MKPLVRIGAVLALLLVGALAVLPVAQAAPVELVTNGDFEAGTLAGWTVTDQAGGSGTVFLGSGVTSPFSGFATVGPAAGTYYAVSDQGGPGAHALTQAFTVPLAGCTVTLSFDMFVNDQSGAGPLIDPAGLDYTAIPNQHARVDVLTGAAGALDTGAGVLQNFYLGIDAGANPNPYTAYSFDISAAVAAGGTFQVRFAEVDNQLFFQQGVDNVSITADCGEPYWEILASQGGGNIYNPNIPAYTPGNWSTKPVILHLKCLHTGGAPTTASGDLNVTFYDGIHWFSTTNQICKDKGGSLADPIVDYGPIMVDTKAPTCTLSPTNFNLAKNNNHVVNFSLSYSDATSGVASVVESHVASGGAIVNSVSGANNTQFDVFLPNTTAAKVAITWTVTDNAGNVKVCSGNIKAK